MTFDPPVDESFRELLRSRLQERGDLTRLSKSSQIASHVLGRWERAESRPTPANLEKLAPALGVAYEDLLKMCGYLPGEPTASTVQSELQVRMKRLGDLLSNLPRPFWLAVIEASERMAEAGELLQATSNGADPSQNNHQPSALAKVKKNRKSTLTDCLSLVSSLFQPLSLAFIQP